MQHCHQNRCLAPVQGTCRAPHALPAEYTPNFWGEKKPTCVLGVPSTYFRLSPSYTPSHASRLRLLSVLSNGSVRGERAGGPLVRALRAAPVPVDPRYGLCTPPVPCWFHALRLYLRFTLPRRRTRAAPVSGLFFQSRKCGGVRSAHWCFFLRLQKAKHLKRPVAVRRSRAPTTRCALSAFPA